MKKKIRFVAIIATLCLCSCSSDFSDSVNSAPAQYSEWKMPNNFTPTEKDYDNIAPIADEIWENWTEFHNWEMPEDIIEGYTSETPTFEDLWMVISWSMMQDSFMDTIGETDWWCEWIEQNYKIYWQ